MEIVEEVLDMSEEFVPITVDVENLSEEASVKSMKVRGNIESHHQPPTPSAVVSNREENASFASKFRLVFISSYCWTMEIVEEVLDMSEEFVPITVDVENLSEEASVKSMKVRGNIESHHQPPTPSAVVSNREENASFASKFVSKLTKFFEHKG
ncbi:unnamed protein product [Prunus brigantina]